MIEPIKNSIVDMETDDLETETESEDEEIHKILGENGCPAYLSNESACIDFFFNVVPDTPLERLHELLGRSWAEDPATTLRLVFNLGNVRRNGRGKADRIN